MQKEFLEIKLQECQEVDKESVLLQEEQYAIDIIFIDNYFNLKYFLPHEIKNIF